MEIDPESKPLRLFVAIAVPPEVRASMKEAQVRLREECPAKAVAWTRSEQFHLTLKFLGNVAETQVAALREAIDEVCHGFGPMRIRAEGLGAFPDLRFPRVVWVGLKEPAGRLEKLQREIETATRCFTNEPAEKHFNGHVTIGRAKRINRREAQVLGAMLAKDSDRLFGEWLAEGLELVQSVLSAEGARHTPLQTFPFSGGPTGETV